MGVGGGGGGGGGQGLRRLLYLTLFGFAKKAGFSFYHPSPKFRNINA